MFVALRELPSSSKDESEWSCSASLDDSEVNRGQPDSNPLIPQIGRDTSANCLARCRRFDYGAIASLNSSFRSLVRTGEIYDLRRKMGIIEYWVYFMCNILEWEAFDPVNRRWMHLPRMQTSDCFKFSDKESLGVGTEILVFGREIFSQIIYKYSLLTNSWSEAPMTNVGRCLFGSASVGKLAFVAGGCDRLGNVLCSAEVYNADTGKWVRLPDMKHPRKMCSGVFIDGCFVVVGGIGADNKTTLTCAEAFYLKTRTWIHIQNMFPAEEEPARPAASKAPPLLAVVKDELYAAFYDEQELKKYNKPENSWVTLGPLPEQADSMNGWGLAFRACGDMLVVIGGPRSMCCSFVEVNGWVPDEGPPVWRMLGRKPSENFVYNCTVMGC